jgi:hypothetical protein
VIVERAKSAAEILAVHPLRRNSYGPLIVLAVQHYGSGRSAAFTADTTRKWLATPGAHGELSPFHRFWGQLVRWLARAEIKERAAGADVSVLISKAYYQPGEKVLLRAKVRDTKGMVTAYANVTARIVRPGLTGKVGQDIEMEPVTDETGLYQLVYDPPRSGNYSATIRAIKEGQPLGEAKTEWTVGKAATEFDRLAVNAALAGELANETRGRMVTPIEMGDILAELKNEVRAKLGISARQPSFQIYDYFTWLFLLVVVLITAEWLLRRHWQLV